MKGRAKGVKRVTKTSAGGRTYTKSSSPPRAKGSPNTATRFTKRGRMR